MDETWCTDVTSQEVIKEDVVKSWVHRARFHVTMLTNHDGYLGPFWTARSPKLDKKEEFFDDTCGLAQNLTWMYCLSTYLQEKCPFFTLRSKVDLIWTFAVRPVIAQSVHFNKISKTQNIDLCQFFSHWKEAQFLLKSWNKKWGSAYSFLR